MRSRTFSLFVITLLLAPGLAAARPSLRTVKETGAALKAQELQQKKRNFADAISALKPATSIPMTPYSNLELGITTHVPDSWGSGKGMVWLPTISILTFSFQDESSKERSLPWFGITAMKTTKIPYDAQFEKEANYNLSTGTILDPDKPILLGMGKVTASDLTIGGYPARNYAFTQSTHLDGKLHHMSYTYVWAGDWLYHFTKDADEGRDPLVQKAYEEFLASMKFSEPKPQAISSTSSSSKRPVNARMSSSKSSKASSKSASSAQSHSSVRRAG